MIRNTLTDIIKCSIIPVTLLTGVTACNSDNDAPAIPEPPIVEPVAPIEIDPATQVTLEYTSYDVPHITATNYQSLSYGQGYAHAKDNMCTLAEQIINVRAKRAVTFGAGENNENINDDFGILALGVYQQAEQSFENLSDEHQAVINGYVQGFNKAVQDKDGASNYPSPCRDETWIPEISNIDLHAFHLRLALLSSGDAVSAQVATANPSQAEQGLASTINELSIKNSKLGSNGWALGKDKTESGNGMLLSNPHFPWAGHLRFVQSHLIIPGELNVTGVGFMGVPGILIGFNDNIAWTHTVSQSKRMTLYTLTLDPENPLSYKFGDDYLDMTSQDYTIEVKADDGTISEVNRTLYSTHYGPMMSWNYSGQVMTFRDANAGNVNIVPQWLAMNRAKNLEEFKQSFAEHQGIPWVNTIATDKTGNAYYIDAARTANLAAPIDAGLKQLLNNPPTDLVSGALQAAWTEGSGQLVLDGANPYYSWLTDESTPVAGTAPYSAAPQMTRTDYVFNANSSHWLTNINAPLEGYSIVYGPEKTIRSPRTRMNGKLLEEVSPTGISGADGKFSLAELKSVVTGQRGLMPELLQAEVVSRCAASNEIMLADSSTVNIADACSVLSNWDGLYTNESVGAHIFRELMREFKSGSHGVLKSTLFENAFDASNPINTPSSLKARAQDASDDSDPVLIALANAVKKLATYQLPLDAKLGELQFHMKNADRISVPGGDNLDGVFNINTGVMLPELGYMVVHGASWVMALEFTEQGPVADAWLTYSQSHDPESEHFSDQTQLFSTGTWRPVLFSDEAIAADLKSTVTLTIE
jgi:acyl-homoserine-lactone acylase